VVTAELTRSGVGSVGGASWSRPINLTVAAEAMLPIRLVIPTEGRQELRHAVALAIRQDTPFDPGEVVAQAVEVERGAGSETYLIQAVPKRLIYEAVRKVGHRRLERIIAGNAGGPDLAAAMFPWRRAMRWLPLLPMAVILIVAGVGGYDVLMEQDRRAGALEVQVTAALAELRRLSVDLDLVEAKAVAGTQIAKAIAAAPSAFLLLEQARRLLPPSSEVLQAELREGELLLSLRTPDALGDLGRFSKAGWTAAIDGAITADPASGREIAVLRLSAASGVR